jgi:hypothetical protein
LPATASSGSSPLGAFFPANVSRRSSSPTHLKASIEIQQRDACSDLGCGCPCCRVRVGHTGHRVLGVARRPPAVVVAGPQVTFASGSRPPPQTPRPRRIHPRRHLLEWCLSRELGTVTTGESGPRNRQPSLRSLPAVVLWQRRALVADGLGVSDQRSSAAARMCSHDLVGAGVLRSARPHAKAWLVSERMVRPEGRRPLGDSRDSKRKSAPKGVKSKVGVGPRL